MDGRKLCLTFPLSFFPSLSLISQIIFLFPHSFILSTFFALHYSYSRLFLFGISGLSPITPTLASIYIVIPRLEADPIYGTMIGGFRIPP